jgi:hypothetical protein
MVSELKTVSDEQARICHRFGVEPFPSPSDLKVGVARNVREGLVPLNGMRHPPSAGTAGWYIWAGTELSSDAGFFIPLHVRHLKTWRPDVLPYLALPPGWRFLIAPGHEDVWFDPSLLDVRG